MTNGQTMAASGGVLVSAAGVVVSHADKIEQWSRIGASWIAIISGCVVIWSVIYKHLKKKKQKNYEHK